MILKERGIVFVVEEKPETIAELKERYGDDNVLERDFYTQHYKVHTSKGVKEFDMTHRGETNTNGTPSKLNRRERRTRKHETRPLYGVQKTNAEARTKHMRTTKERKLERAQQKRVSL